MRLAIAFFIGIPLMWLAYAVWLCMLGVGYMWCWIKWRLI